jgi:nucleoside-diphosphate-sugar epimerase
MIGVTGATGHLGSVILDMLPDAEPIGRTIPDRPFEAIIHTAAPDYRDDDAVITFRDFNLALEQHLDRHPPDALIVTGSWWQHGIGSCRDVLYTRLKDEQVRMFPQAAHLIPYSIYGDDPRPGRGFIPQLIRAVNGDMTLTGLSDQPRDFIHVTDVALAHIRALDVPAGMYAVGSGIVISPRDLAAIFGILGPPLPDEYPVAYPRYPRPWLPDWDLTVDVFEHIRDSI